MSSIKGALKAIELASLVIDPVGAIAEKLLSRALTPDEKLIFDEYATEAAKLIGAIEEGIVDEATIAEYERRINFIVADPERVVRTAKMRAWRSKRRTK